MRGRPGRAYLWILDGKVPKPLGNAPADYLEWGQWFEQADRTVAHTVLDGDILVSTVFLGIDNSFGFGPVAILFESMTFTPPHEVEINGRKQMMRTEWVIAGSRYATWGEAVMGHEWLVKRAQHEIDRRNKKSEKPVADSGTHGK